MRSVLPRLHDVLTEHYGFTITELRRLWSGTTAVHARVITPDGDYFVKTYRLRADFDYELLNIGLAHSWAAAAIPGAVPIATASGGWMHRQTGLALSVWRWIHGRSAAHLTDATARQVGATHARLHRFLDTRDLPTLPINREHARTIPVEHIVSRFEHLLRLATTASEVHAATAQRVRRRLNQLRNLPQQRAGLPAARLGRVHGDLTSANLMVTGDQLTAILDPRIQLAERARELGGIAFDLHTVAHRADWPRIALACITAYRDAGGPLTAEEITATVRHALLHSLTSTYPLEDLLTKPMAPRMRAMQDRYWADLCTTVDRLLPALTAIEDRLAGLTHPRPVAVGGKR